MNRFNPFVRPGIVVRAQEALPSLVRPGIEILAQESVASLPRGYAGPGLYRVAWPNGLNLRSTPDTRNPPLTSAAYGWDIKVLGPAANGWVAVDSSNFYRTGTFRGPNVYGEQPVRFMCMSCPEFPGGPYLTSVFQ